MDAVVLMNIMLFLLLLFFVYVQFVNRKNDKKVIVKALLINRKILKNKVLMIFMGILLFIAITSISMLLYSSIEEFHGTKYFRNEYEISISDVINGNEIQKIADNLSGDEKKNANWALKTINNSKMLMFYVINMVFLIIVFPFIARVRIEKNGVRKLGKLTEFSNYKNYIWEDEEIIFTNLNDKRVLNLSIDSGDVKILKRYLNKHKKMKEVKS